MYSARQFKKISSGIIMMPCLLFCKKIFDGPLASLRAKIKKNIGR